MNWNSKGCAKQSVVGNKSIRKFGRDIQLTYSDEFILLGEKFSSLMVFSHREAATLYIKGPLGKCTCR